VRAVLILIVSFISSCVAGAAAGMAAYVATVPIKPHFAMPSGWLAGVAAGIVDFFLVAASLHTIMDD
jgi:hypothetical protein